MTSSGFNAVDEYIASKPQLANERLQQLREIVLDSVPGTEEAIKWGEPAVIDQDGMILVMYGGYRQHMNLVVTPSTLQVFMPKLSGYKTGKSSIQLSYDQPLHEELIHEIVIYRVDECRSRGVKWM